MGTGAYMPNELFQKLLVDMRESLDAFSGESRRLQNLIEQIGPAISLGEYHALLSQRVRATQAIERYFSQRQELFNHLQLSKPNRTDLSQAAPR